MLAYPQDIGHVDFMPARQEQVVEAESPEDLMRRISQHDDKAAFAKLFNLMAPKVKSFMLQAAADSYADDLTQEVMLKVWTRRSTYDHRKAAVATWIYSIARNTRIDQVRKVSRHTIDLNDPALLPAETAGPDDQVDRSCEAARLRRSLETLPPEQKRVLDLSYFSGLTHQEIADQTGVPFGTIKSRIRLAIKKLLQDLKEAE